MRNFADSIIAAGAGGGKGSKSGGKWLIFGCSCLIVCIICVVAAVILVPKLNEKFVPRNEDRAYWGAS